MLADAPLRALVAARAEIHVEDEDALSFVKSLLDEVRDERIDLRIAPQTRERLLDQATAQHGKLAHHFEEVGAGQARKLEIIQGRARRSAQPARDRIGEI